MKKIGVAVTDPGDWTGISLCNSIEYYGMTPVKFSFNEATSDISSGKIYSGNIDLTALEAVIVRDLGPATHNDVSFRFDILCQLKELGIAVINSPDSIAKAANKYVSSFLFQKNGIPTPKTIVTNKLDEAAAALSSFGRAVVKPVFGYKGIGVECVRDSKNGVEKLKKLFKEKRLIYIQEFIPNPGRDIRVFVVNGKVAGSIYRVAPEGGWINNLSQGGSAKPCVLTGEQERLALKAAAVIGTVYAGVDIIEGDYVIEINGTPSGKGIFEASGVDVTRMIAEYLEGLILPKN
ncbi:MAG: RimK family alpha-L-glutamate ligase [Candidatus Methanoperedens sp.]|nr:RimK family alpha-L-glutamate ligase [Candidatus Methanoperedens sp.]MCZ7403821.1 RimK family alpha-L-glutamate ligase [Candidatus Methanoperedens sp.]